MKLYCADCMDILFLSTLSLRRATDYLDLCVKYNIFLSTLSLRRATSERPETLLSYAISIHALLAESDWNTTQLEYNPIISIHALLAESDQPARPRSGTAGKISIHALLAESDHYDNYNLHCVEISIHALLAESDYDTYAKVLRVNISIHALLAESDIGPLIFSVQPRNFNPRSPCGERRRRGVSCYLDNIISIHALLAESDS